MGLMVVFARRNDTMPEMLILWPMATRASAMPARTPNGTTTGGTSEDANHMKSARHNAKTGGGTLSSRASIMMKMRANVGRVSGRRLLLPATGASFGTVPDYSVKSSQGQRGRHNSRTH